MPTVEGAEAAGFFCIAFLVLFTVIITISTDVLALLGGIFFFKKRQSVSDTNHNMQVQAPVDVSPAAISAPPQYNRSWSPDQACVRRAAFLSRIVYFDAHKARDELQRYESQFGFKFVNLQKQEYEKVHQMVVAVDHSSTLYVCFRGTKGIQDLITDGLLRPDEFRSADLGVLDSGIQGSYHRGFLACLDQRVFPMRILHDLVRSRSSYHASRVVFCGHSLGGALAHLALIKYMLANAGCIGPDVAVAGIAFAAPHVCDEVGRGYLRGHALNIEKKLYNFVALEDPVPFLLNSLPHSGDMLVRAVGEAGPSWIERHTVIFKIFDGVRPEAQESLRWLVQKGVSIACERFINPDFLGHMGRVIGALLDREVKGKLDSGLGNDYKWYVPIGNWFTCKGRMGTDEAGERKDELRNADLSRHGMARYFDDICTNGSVQWHFPDEVPASTTTSDNSEEVQEIRIAAPRIRNAVWQARERVVKVIGDDLELVVQARVDAVVWQHQLGMDRPREVRLSPPASHPLSSEASQGENYPSKVDLVTCFGEASHVISIQHAPVSVTWPNSHVALTHQQCTLKLGLLTKDLPEGAQKYAEELNLLHLTNDIDLSPAASHSSNSGAEDDQQSLAWLVSQFWLPLIHRILRKYVFTKVFIDVAATVGVTDNVISYSGKSALYGGCAGGVTGGCMAVASALAEAGVVLSSVPGVLLSGATVVGIPAAAAAAVGGLGFCLGRNLYYLYWRGPSPALQADGTSPHEKVVQDYMKILHLTSTVLGFQGLRMPMNDHEMSDLERRIGKAFSDNKASLIQLKNSIVRKPTDDCDGRAVVSATDYGGEGATIARRSVAECVARAKFIHDVLEVGNRLTMVKVVLIVGPQNAGKSSLINCILGKEVAATGYRREHTSDLKVYRAGDEIRGKGTVVFVDSPGTDSDDRLADVKAAWQSMEGVPDLVIMVMLFQGDTNETVQQLPTSVARWTKCRNQMLLLNKCDQILSDTSCLNDDLHPQAMREIRIEAAHRANVKPEDAIMTVLKDSHISAAIKSRLKERGVLLKSEAKRKLLERIERLTGYINTDEETTH